MHAGRCSEEAAGRQRAGAPGASSNTSASDTHRPGRTAERDAAGGKRTRRKRTADRYLIKYPLPVNNVERKNNLTVLSITLKHVTSETI